MLQNVANDSLWVIQFLFWSDRSKVFEAHPRINWPSLTLASFAKFIALLSQEQWRQILTQGEHVSLILSAALSIVCNILVSDFSGFWEFFKGVAGINVRALSLVTRSNCFIKLTLIWTSCFFQIGWADGKKAAAISYSSLGEFRGARCSHATKLQFS